MTDTRNHVPAFIQDIFKSAAEQQAYMRAWMKPYDEMQRSWRAFGEHARHEYERFVAQSQRFVQSLLDSLSAEARKFFPILLSHGWYPDLKMAPSGLAAVCAEFEKARNRKANAALCRYYDDEIGRISRDLLAKYPARSKALRSAIWAHRRKRYYLSVPVFLAQADGICLEKLGENYFRKKNRKPATAAIAEAEGAHWSALLLPLALALPISASSSERASNARDYLNRHAVLHGESSTYGTRVFSCQALSLLNYVGTVLHLFDRSHGRPSNSA